LTIKDFAVQRGKTMPIYEFKCKKCGNIFEFLCFHSDEKENPACPSCGGKKSEKLLSVFSSSSSGADKGSGASLGASSCSSASGFS
jgi:putative FmdB family regulatory protein